MLSDQIADFGHSASRQPVQRITLRSDVLEVSVLTLGAILQAVRLAGLRPSVVVGFDNAEGYGGANMYCGAIVGPVAGRLRGAEAMIGDQLWRFDPNEGQQLLHSGAEGVHQRLWQIAELGEDHVTLALDLAHCEGGFPGMRRFEARYRVADHSLALDLITRTDRPTLANLAPHAFWNLGGRNACGASAAGCGGSCSACRARTVPRRRPCPCRRPSGFAQRSTAWRIAWL